MMSGSIIVGAVLVASVALALPHRPCRPRPLPSAGARELVSRPPGSDHRHLVLVEGTLRALHLDLDPTATLVALRGAVALGVVAALLVGGAPAATLAGSVVLLTPRLARRVLARRTAAQREQQLVPMLEAMASDLRAGSALAPAFVAVAHATAAPLGNDLRVVAAEIQHGAPLGQALDRWGARAGDGGAVHLVVAALTVAATAGGEVARSVDRLASTLRERRDLRAEVRSLATQARASAAVLVAAPLGFAALVAGVEPGAITFLASSPIGLLCLAGGLTLDALGATWMGRILRDTP